MRLNSKLYFVNKITPFLKHAKKYMEQMKLSVQKHLQDMSRGEYDKGILQKSMDFDGLL